MRVKTKVIEETTLEEYMNDFIRFKMANTEYSQDYLDSLPEGMMSTHSQIA